MLTNISGSNKNTQSLPNSPDLNRKNLAQQVPQKEYNSIEIYCLPTKSESKELNGDFYGCFSLCLPMNCDSQAISFDYTLDVQNTSFHLENNLTQNSKEGYNLLQQQNNFESDGFYQNSHCQVTNEQKYESFDNEENLMNSH